MVPFWQMGKFQLRKLADWIQATELMCGGICIQPRSHPNPDTVTSAILSALETCSTKLSSDTEHRKKSSPWERQEGDTAPLAIERRTVLQALQTSYTASWCTMRTF